MFSVSCFKPISLSILFSTRAILDSSRVLKGQCELTQRHLQRRRVQLLHHPSGGGGQRASILHAGSDTRGCVSITEERGLFISLRSMRWRFEEHFIHFYCILICSMSSVSSLEIIRKVKKPPPMCRPTVAPDQAPLECIQLMKQCWSETPERRPTFHEIFDRVHLYIVCTV